MPTRNRLLGLVIAGLALVPVTRAILLHTTVSDALAARLRLPDTNGPSEAIVVLGAGVTEGCTPNLTAMRRTLLAVRLFKEGRAPVLLFTGGVVSRSSCAVADAMARFAEELGVPPGAALTEPVSRTTWEDADRSAPLLERRGIRRIVLVTDSLHMRRAEACFRSFGFETGRASVPAGEVCNDRLDMFARGVHEIVGWWYYRLRGRF